MESATFKIRGETKASVQASIEALALVKNANGSYTHENAQIFKDEVGVILEAQFYNGDDGLHGMRVLLTGAPANSLTTIKATSSATRATVLAASKEATVAISTTLAPVEPYIKTNADAQDEADRQNMYILEVVGAKKGVVAGVTTISGKEITGAVLHSVNSTTIKNVYKYTLHELMQAVIDGTDRPATKDVRQQHGAIIATGFDFLQKMLTCVEILNSRIPKIGTYGIKVGPDQVVMVILANSEAATEWIPEHRIALTAIRAAYKYEHEHDSSSLTAIMKELATAEESRDRCKAPAPEAYAATGGYHLGILSGMIEDYIKTGNHGEANAVAYDTDSSDRTRRDHGRSKIRKATTRRRSPIRSPSTSLPPLRLAPPPAQEVQKQGQEQGKGPRKRQGQNKKKDQK